MKLHAPSWAALLARQMKPIEQDPESLMYDTYKCQYELTQSYGRRRVSLVVKGELSGSSRHEQALVRVQHGMS